MDSPVHPDQLDWIEADDGRKVTFDWDAENDGASSLPDPEYIQSVKVVTTSSGTRTWYYDYQPASPGYPGIVELVSVRRPDNAEWTFGLTAFLTSAQPQTSSVEGCSYVQTASNFEWMGTMDSPTGLHGEFKITTGVRGRAQVPHECWGGPGNVELHGFAVMPYVSYPLAISSRKFTGAGIDASGDGALEWNYNYSDPHPSWNGESPPAPYNNCSGTECESRWIEVTDPRSHVATTTYQAFDRPAYGAATHVVFADTTTTTTIDRDVYGKPESMVQTGQYPGYLQRSVTHTFAYDQYEQLCLQTSPETGRTGYGYFDNGLLEWSAQGLSGFVDPCASNPNPPLAKKVTRAYDPRNRLTDIDYPAGTPDTHFHYNDDGQVQTAVRGASTWTMTYFNRGMLDTEQLSIDGHTFTLDYDYDSQGNRNQVQYPSGRTLNLSPDALGRPSKLGTYAYDIHYAENGRPGYFYYGNDVFFHEKLNMRGLPRTLEYRRFGEYYTYRVLGYDPNTNPVYILEDGIFGGGYPIVGGTGGMDPVGTDNRWFTYDELDRLEEVESGWLGTETYRYDPLGNVRSRTVTGGADGNFSQTWDYFSATNRLKQLNNGPIYQYDDRGNVTASGNFEIDVNRAGETVGHASGTFYETEFAYDARGWRVKELLVDLPDPNADVPITRYFIYDSAGRLLERWEDDNDPDSVADTVTDFVYLGTRPIARIEGGATSYIHTDYQNTPLFETDSLGEITRYPVFYAYGQPSIAGSTFTPGTLILSAETEESPGYAGSYPMGTGQLYMGARFSGYTHFLSPDPAPLNPLSPVGLNRYAYANDNPMRFTDPLGLCAEEYEDGSCKVRNEDDSDEGRAKQKMLEDYLNRYDDAFNGLDDDSMYNVFSHNDGTILGQMSGREIKKWWNNQTFTIVPNGTFNNGGHGATVPGATRLEPQAIAQYISASGSTETGVSTIIMHELGHVTDIGQRILRHYGGVTPGSRNYWERESKTHTVGRELSGSVGAPFSCALMRGGCF